MAHNHRRARPPKQKREHLRQIRNVGQLSIDLAHIKAKDFESVLGEKGHDYMGVPGKRGYQQDRYFLNAVDLLTGYLITEIVQGKTANEIAPKLSKLIDRYEKQLGQKVKKVEVDKGGEFRGVTRKMLDDRGIRTIEKITNAAVEQTNAKMQRIFWALVEQRRGGFLATAKQAVKISNRTYNRRIRMSPEDALEKIVAAEKISKKTPKAGPTEKKRAWKVGEKVRALKKPRARGTTSVTRPTRVIITGQLLLSAKCATVACTRSTWWAHGGVGETRSYARDPPTPRPTTL